MIKHKYLVIILVFLTILQPIYGNKLRIAILDIKAGVGENTSHVDGLEDM